MPTAVHNFDLRGKEEKGRETTETIRNSGRSLFFGKRKRSVRIKLVFSKNIIGHFSVSW